MRCPYKIFHKIMARIPQNILEEILGRVDIVELIGGYIPLKKAGRNFKALCPFHHEKTGSFMVSPDKQIFHCFGCGESGNAFKFLVRYERMEFPEAVETLAKKAGVSLPEFRGRDEAAGNLINEIYRANQLSASFYQAHLNSAAGKQAVNYLVGRGIKEETAALFKLGLAPQGWDGLISHLRSQGVSLANMEKAGLITPRENGGYYDRFRNRLIFPIMDIKSRVLGFGARVLDDSLPKYINSPETHVYTKGRNLYGLGMSREFIRDSDRAVIVEGYLDFIIPFQAGIRNIAASSGTALTQEQARLIKRYTHNVVVIFDPDAAGEMAALRSLDIFIEQELSVRVAALPAGSDPDIFVRKKGAAAFNELVDKAAGLFDYKLNLLRRKFDPRDIEGKAKIADSMLATINKIANSVLRSEYMKKLAEELDVKEEALSSRAKNIGTPQFAALNQAVPAKTAPVNPVEKLLINLILEETQFIHRLKEHMKPEDFRDQRVASIISLMLELAEAGKDVGPQYLMEHFGRQELTNLVCESVFLPEEFSGQDRGKLFDECLQRLKIEKNKTRRSTLHEEIKLAQGQGDQEKLQRLLEEFHDLLKD